jgi:hypothetical protein
MNMRFASDTNAGAKLLVNVDLRLMLQFDGDRETLMGDFLACPPPLGKDCEVIIIAMAIDVSRHLERRGLERACAANVAGQACTTP